MTSRYLLVCLLSGILLSASCSRKNEAPAPSAENNPPAPTSTAPAQPPAEQPPPAPPPTAAVPPVTPPAETAVVPRKPEPAPPAVARQAPPPAPKPQPIVIPAGTVLTVRLQQEVSSKENNAGDRFEASLAQPIVVQGKTVIPAGATAGGTVTDAKSAGKFKGGASLDLALNSLVVHGNHYRIQTESLAQTSKGKGSRTAKMVGGGTAGGALIGGIAGGGKGAAIGALVGAGAGTAGAGLTGNKNDIVLPAESAVSFKLAAPLTLKPAAPPGTQPQE